MNTEDDEFKRIEREQAMRGVPDAIHHTDKSEPLEYIQGWNDCRAAMLAEQPAHQEPFGYFKAEPFGWTDCAETDEGAVALYTTPQAQPAQPAREPLTDEQMAKAWAVADGEHNASASVKRRITRAIEAAYNIKENQS